MFPYVSCYLVVECGKQTPEKHYIELQSLTLFRLGGVGGTGFCFPVLKQFAVG